MGGICFVVALLPILLIPNTGDVYFSQLFYLVAACALIGLIDDTMAIRLDRNRGLRARTKFLFTALFAVMFLRSIGSAASVDVILQLPNYAMHVPHWLWLILGIIAITGTIHAVNLTDGLDGLAAGAIIMPLATIGTVWAQTSNGSWFPAALEIGACLAFLIFNKYPAKLIMGDTGSLALGALLSGIAILSGEMLLLVIVGFVFVAETLSVMLQVVYFKLTHGKRIFKMSPLHHHFELSGWPETKVTTRFWIASAVCSAVGLAIVR